MEQANVMSYLKFHRLPLSLENKSLGFSFRSLMGADMAMIREKFPSDYAKIKRDFPLIDASIKHLEAGHE